MYKKITILVFFIIFFFTFSLAQNNFFSIFFVSGFFLLFFYFFLTIFFSFLNSKSKFLFKDTRWSLFIFLTGCSAGGQLILSLWGRFDENRGHGWLVSMDMIIMQKWNYLTNYFHFSSHSLSLSFFSLSRSIVIQNSSCVFSSSSSFAKVTLKF